MLVRGCGLSLRFVIVVRDRGSWFLVVVQGCGLDCIRDCHRHHAPRTGS